MTNLICLRQDLLNLGLAVLLFVTLFWAIYKIYQLNRLLDQKEVAEDIAVQVATQKSEELARLRIENAELREGRGTILMREYLAMVDAKVALKEEQKKYEELERKYNQMLLSLCEEKAQ